MAYGAYIPTLTAPFIGNAPGVWEDLRPPNRSCWRLINDDYTSGWDGMWGAEMVGDVFFFFKSDIFSEEQQTT